MIETTPQARAHTKYHNRVGAIMTHLTRYSFRGTSRLAADAGVAKSTISHLVHGLNNPLFITVRRVVKCLEYQLGRKLDIDEVVSLDGRYPTMSVCQLCRCRGCLPDAIFQGDGSRKDGLSGVTPGHWSGDVTEFDSEVGELEDSRTE